MSHKTGKMNWATYSHTHWCSHTCWGTVCRGMPVSPSLRISHKLMVKVAAAGRGSAGGSASRRPCFESHVCWWDSVPPGVLDNGNASVPSPKISPRSPSVPAYMSLSNTAACSMNASPSPREGSIWCNLTMEMTSFQYCQHIIVETRCIKIDLRKV